MEHYIVVDVGGTKLLSAVLDAEGAVLARHKEKTDRSSQKALLGQLQDCITQAAQVAGIPLAEVTAIALGVPGVVDTARGYVVYTPNAPLSDLPLAQKMSARFGVPVTVANDVNLGTFGECWRGVARDAASAYGIFVGTGIGGGYVIDGRLVEGYRGLSGEIGHLMIPLGADLLLGAPERKHLFLEELCSRTAIENQLRHAILRQRKVSCLPEIVHDPKLKRIRSRALREALRRKDPLVVEVVRRASYLLGLATASVLHVVDPEVIIFGGGVIAACGDWMLPWIEKTARKVAMPGTGRPLKILRSALGDDAILVGGLALLQQGLHLHPSQPDAAAALISSEPPVIAVEVDRPLGAPASK